MASVSSTLLPFQIQSLDNLFQGASKFYQDSSFVNQVYTFISMVIIV